MGKNKCVYLEFFAYGVLGDCLRDGAQLSLGLRGVGALPDRGVGPVDQDLLHAGLLLVESDQPVVDLLVDSLVAVQQRGLHLQL